MPLLDAAIGGVFAPYDRPGRRHGNLFRRQKSSCGVVKSLSEASVRRRGGCANASDDDAVMASPAVAVGRVG